MENNKADGHNQNSPNQDIRIQPEGIQGELDLPLYTKQLITDVSLFSNIVFDLDKELKIRRDSLRRTKILQSQLRELAVDTQKYNEYLNKLKLDKLDS